MKADTTELTPEPSGTEPPACPAAEEKRWSALLALLTAWMLPATTARRTAHVSLRDAYVVHWLAVILAALLAVLLGGVTFHPDRAFGADGILAATAALLDEIAEEFEHDPDSSVLFAAAIVIGVELTFIALGVLLAPWGARDEPIRASVASSLRRVWLHTSHVLPAFLLIAVFTNGVMLAKRQWDWAAPTLGQPAWTASPSPPPVPAAELTGSRAWQDYEAALERYRKQLHAWQRRAELERRYAYAHQQAHWGSRPWYAEYGEEAIGYVCFFIVTWFLWALFRAVGAPRVIPSVPRPPTCEFCGYNLIVTPIRGRCSECGRPVERSLAPGGRTGTAWQRARGLARMDALWQSSFDAIRRPEVIGRQIRLSTASGAHRWIVALVLPVVFLIAVVGATAACGIQLGGSPRVWSPEVIVVAPLAGYTTVIIALLVILGTAWLVAICYRLNDERNLLCATIQIAAYLGGFIALWAGVSALVGVTAFIVNEWLWRQRIWVRIDYGAIFFGIWLVMNLLCLIGYVYLVRRATGAARYANR